MEKHQPLGPKSVLPFLRDAYGPAFIPWILRDWHHAMPSNFDNSRVSASLSALRAPQFCAVLSQLNDDLEAHVGALGFHRALPDIRLSKVSHRRREVIRLPQSVTEARQVACELAANVPSDTGPNWLPKRYRLLYWYLRMKDRQWLFRTFDGLKERSSTVPSLEQDRVMIMERIRAKRARHPHRPAALDFDAAIRARIRDEEWLLYIVSENKQAVWSADRKRQTKRFRKARQTVLASPAKPSKLTQTALAKAAGLTREEATSLFKRYPSLKQLLFESEEELSLIHI